MIERIADRYEVIEMLGSGGMGSVYRAKDLQLNSTVAVKQLHTHLTDEHLIERFQREGDALRELNHPNIVKMLNYVENAGRHYLVMEYVPGSDLADILAQQELKLERILNLAIDLADALTRAHKLNIIHRDLKPANVLIGDDGILRLTDFGVAHVGSKQRVTDTDAIIGTIDYLPPEVFENGQFDERGDVWAFGVILFEMLTGERPFKGDSLLGVMHAIANEPIPDIENLRPDVSTAIVDLVYRMLERDPTARIPSVRIVGAELEAIQHGRFDATPPASHFETPTPEMHAPRKVSLPAQITPFVGREAELETLRQLIQNDAYRLITVLAPGGMGKTRLAIEAAKAQINNYRDGVYFVDLTAQSNLDGIVNAIINATGFTPSNDGQTAKQQLLNYLSNKHKLLVIDNWEHLIDHTEIVIDILQAAPDVNVLATSRRRLEQAGETVFNLDGLEFPNWETPDDALAYAAIQLFMNSATRAYPAFELTNDNLDDVARICRLVAGMPLGIVLAASWVGMLSPQEIVEEIARGIDFLEAAGSEVPQRQQSIKVVFDYTFDLLSDVEQDIWVQLSIFNGGFTRQAAQVVTGATLRQLMALANKSLIRRDKESGRYSIHELARQYAFDKLESSGEHAAVRDTHLTFYSDFLVQLTPSLKGGKQLDALQELEAELDNVRAVWQHAQTTEQWPLLEPMVEPLSLLTYRGRTSDVINLFMPLMQALRSAPQPSEEQEQLIARLAGFYVADAQVPFSEQEAIIRHGLELARKHAKPFDIAKCLENLALVVGNQGRNLEAEALIEEAVPLATTLEDSHLMARSLRALGIYGYLNGKEDLYGKASEQSYAIAKEQDDIILLMYPMNNYAIWQEMQFNYDEALALQLEVLRLTRLVGDVGMIPFRLGNLSRLYADEMQVENLRQMLAEAKALANELNSPLALCMWYDLDGTLAILEGRADDAYVLLQRSVQEAVRYGNQDVILNNRRMLGFAAIFTNRFEIGLTILKEVLAIESSNTGYTIRRLLWVLPVFSYLLKQENDLTRCVELISLTMNHPHSRPYHTQFYYTVQIQSELEAMIDKNDYNAAWERGKSLDIIETVHSLLNEFCALYGID